MGDTVSVRASMDFKAWPIPDRVYLDMPARPKQEGIQPLPSYTLDEVEPAVLDALAQTWLDQLYASVNRSPPFKKVGP